MVKFVRLECYFITHLFKINISSADGPRGGYNINFLKLQTQNNRKKAKS